jgi:dihydropteroate synthase
MIRYRPLPMTDPARPAGALPLAGGWCWFTLVEMLERGRPPQVVPVSDVPADVLDRLTAPRAPIAGLAMDRPCLMGILNVTPDSFSDGGRFLDAGAGLDQALQMMRDGAAILDIGGESTRPGAAEVPVHEEIARTAPVIAALRDAGLPLSIDTRKAAVAQTALAAGAGIVNDVSALTFDPALAGVVAAAAVPLVLMHAQGTPATMQDAPVYANVLLDVYDFLEERLSFAEAVGIDRARIIVDPGIGFGKTTAHNLALIRGLALFHGLGCPILLGASRKKFIGTLSAEDQPDRRVAGSLAVALAGVAQGVQILRVHDVRETSAALALWQAVHPDAGGWCMTRKLFGTDGVRGTANTYPMTAEMALRLGAAAGRFFRRAGGGSHRVVIGKDTRLSGYMLENALTAGLTSTGMNVLLLGPVPTPAVGFLTRSMRADLGRDDQRQPQPAPGQRHQVLRPRRLQAVGRGRDRDRGDPGGRGHADPARRDRARDADRGWAGALSGIRQDDLSGRVAAGRAQGGDRLRQRGRLSRGARGAVGTGGRGDPIGVSPNGLNINLRCGSTHTDTAAEAVVAHGADVGICWMATRTG